MEFKTETERLLDMVEYAMELGLFNPDTDLLEKVAGGERTENQYILDLATHSHALQYLEDELREIRDSVDLNTASGEFLDCLGRLVGVARYPAQAPQVLVELELEVEPAENIMIPAGTGVILRDMDPVYGEYVTSEDVVLVNGTSTGSVMCECTELGVHPALPEDSVLGLSNIGVTASNSSRGTCGRNIEDDDSYRERIRAWNAKYVVGTRACITDYLNHYAGLDSYNLVPKYDGGGTLKVVCDTLEENLEGIREGLVENCMSISDAEPLCVLPDVELITTLTLTITKSNVTNAYSDEELKNAILSQAYVFVNGGTTRSGLTRQGMVIGEDFNPSQLVAYLLGEFPECANIVSSVSEVVSVPDTARLTIEDLEVVINV